MASQKIVNHKESAEIYQGEVLCKKQILEVLDEIHLPKGLFPLDGIVEMGYNRRTGFVWLKRNKKLEHKNLKIGKLASYDTEVTAFAEDRRLRKVTGVKGKELLFWVPVSDAYVNDKDSRKITFCNSTGISQSFPISAFELEEEHEKKRSIIL